MKTIFKKLVIQYFDLESLFENLMNSCPAQCGCRFDIPGLWAQSPSRGSIPSGGSVRCVQTCAGGNQLMLLFLKIN